MPTNDDPAPTPARRPLGRGPGTQPARHEGEPGSAGGAVTPETGAQSARPATPSRHPASPPRNAGGESGGSGRDVRAPAGGAAVGDEGAERRPGSVDAAEGEGEGEGEGGPEDIAAAAGQEPEGAEAGPEGAGGEGGVGQVGAEGGFQVRLHNFEGPFDLLLQLIAKHKLDVTEVALSKVTDEFIAHIRAMGSDWDLDQATEFLVVAATLLDLKAARLLPAAEVEDEEDLALLEARDLLFARLLQYRAYKEIAAIFADRWAAELRHHPRTVGLEPHHAELLPEVVMSIGPEEFAKLAAKAMVPKPKPTVYVEHIHAPLVSVREQAGIMVDRLRKLGSADFRTLTEDAPDALTVVARFLALLELYRERAVALDQEEALGELRVRWTGGDDGETPLVTDEFDQEAQDENDRKGKEER